MNTVSTTNIVQPILDMLASAGFGNLSRFIGESEEKTRTAAQAAVPALLAGVSKQVSSGDGVQKVISALRQMDPRIVNNPGSVLTESAEEVAEKGGSLLGSLFSGNAITAIINALSRYAGIGLGSAKNLLGYLTPLVLGFLSKQFAGKSINKQGLTDLFSSHKADIVNAIPSGLALTDLPGVTPPTYDPLKPTASTHPYEPAREARSGFPWWILPLALLAVVGGLYMYWIYTKPSIATVPDVGNVTKDLTGNFSALTETLKGIKDSASVDAALPRINELSGKLEGMKALVDKLPDAGKTRVVEQIKSSMGTLQDEFLRVLMIPGASDKLRPALEGVVNKATSLGGLPTGQFTLPSVEVTRVGSEVSDVISSLNRTLTGVKDVATAEAALPELNRINLKLDSTRSAWDRIPESGRATLGPMFSTALESLKALVAKVLAYTGVDEKLGSVLKQIMSKLPTS
jgi:hypothetical protein